MYREDTRGVSNSSDETGLSQKAELQQDRMLRVNTSSSTIGHRGMQEGDPSADRQKKAARALPVPI